jgi:ABC-2 type transport system permease protein
MQANIFVDPATMPAWLRTAVEYNPVTHLAGASRDLMHGQDPGGSIAWVLIASAIVTAIFAPIALRLYYKER